MPQLKSSLKRNSKFIEEVVCPSPKLEGNRIHLLQYHIADDCNLKCKHCSHFSPLCKPYKYNKYEILRDLERMAQLTDTHPLDDIAIIGGEPLLNKEITFYMEKTRKLFPTTSITIITNALLLPKMKKDFFKCAFKNKITIVMSKYFEDSFYEPIIKILDSYSINWRFTPDRFGGMNFVSCKLCKNPKYTKEEAWDLCPTKNSCILLREGRVYSCPSIPFRSQVIQHFKENIPVFNEGIDIYMNTYEEIIEQLQQPKESCRYCSDDTFKCVYFHSLATYEKKDYIEN